MTDFTAFNATTHGIIKMEDDWNNLLDHALEKQAHFIVRVNGSYYEAINGSTGKISYGGSANAGGITGTSASGVIQAALDNLTSGRTWKEKVILKGNFTVSSALEIQSYTHVVLIGKITLSNAANVHLINNADAGYTDIEVEGGWWDGNGDTQTSTYKYIMYFNAVTNLRIHNAIFNNGHYGALYIKGSSFSIYENDIRNNDAYTWSYGIAVDGGLVDGSASPQRAIHNNRFYGNQQHIYMINAVWDISIHDNLILSGKVGITLEVGAAADINITHNYIDSCSMYGMYLKGLNNGSIESNRIEEAAYHGIYLTLIEKRNVICNNEIYDSSRAADVTYDGIYIASITAEASLDQHYESLKIIGNNICVKHTVSYGTNYRARYGINIVPAIDQLWIQDNFIEGGTAAWNFTGGTGNNCEITNNMLGTIAAGTVTYKPQHNSGSSTGTGLQQTIAHGVAGIPTKVILWDIENGAAPYQSAAADATNIYVTATNNQDWGWEVEYVP